MNKLKLIVTMLLTFTVLLAQVGHVAAAPALQTSTSITGTITAITTETDSAGVTTVLVTLQDAQGATQTVRLSAATAASPALALVTVDPITNAVTVDQTKIGQSVTIDTSMVIPDTTTQAPVNPISALLGAFFGEDASIIDGWHQDGTGFGVIAQALWMAKNLDGEVSFEDILQAKKDGSGTLTLSNGTEITYTNWGQLKKQLLDKHNNLGSVVSGHASDDGFQPGQGNGNGHGNNNGNGQVNDNKNGNGHNKP